MRLRTLSEAECYARCYGERGGEGVEVVRILPRRTKRRAVSGEQLRALFEDRLDRRGPEIEAA